MRAFRVIPRPMRSSIFIGSLFVGFAALSGCGRPVPIDAAEPRELIGKEWTSCVPAESGFESVLATYEAQAVRWSFRRHEKADCSDAPKEELAVVRTGYFRRAGASEYVFHTTGGSETGTTNALRIFGARRSPMPPLEDCRGATFQLTLSPDGALTHTLRAPRGPSSSVRLHPAVR